MSKAQESRRVSVIHAPLAHVRMTAGREKDQGAALHARNARRVHKDEAVLLFVKWQDALLPADGAAHLSSLVFVHKRFLRKDGEVVPASMGPWCWAARYRAGKDCPVGAVLKEKERPPHRGPALDVAVPALPALVADVPRGDVAEWGSAGRDAAAWLRTAERAQHFSISRTARFLCNIQKGGAPRHHREGEPKKGHDCASAPSLRRV